MPRTASVSARRGSGPRRPSASRPSGSRASTRRRSTRAPAAPRATPRISPPARPRRTRTFAFTATLDERGPTGLWPHLFLPAAASEWLGRRGAVPVILSVDGAKFRRTARPDGDGGHFVLFNAEMRERSGIEPGDRFAAALEVDRAPRALETPRDLAQSLRDDPVARGAFAAMPPSHRRAYVEFIEEAKRPETRVRRIQQALRMMAEWGAQRARAKSRS